MTRPKLALLAVVIVLSSALVAVASVRDANGDHEAHPGSPTATPSSTAEPRPSAPSSTPAPSRSAPADPCDSSWCWRFVQGYEVGGLYKRDGEWGTEFILEHGARVCARPIATPPGLREILIGDEPVWEAYAPDNTAAHDTYVFQSAVGDDGRCDGPLQPTRFD